MIIEPRTAFVTKVILYIFPEHYVVRGVGVAVKPNKWPVFLYHPRTSSISTPKDGREIVESIFYSKNQKSRGRFDQVVHAREKTLA